jgi:hypothetical protein
VYDDTAGAEASDLLADMDLATVDEVRADLTGADLFAGLDMSPWDLEAMRSDVMADIVSGVVEEFLAGGLETAEDFASCGSLLDERLADARAEVDVVDVALCLVAELVVEEGPRWALTAPALASRLSPWLGEGASGSKVGALS